VEGFDDEGDDMYDEPPNAARPIGTMTSRRKGIRELAERTSNGTLIRLYWRQGTRDLWVEVWDPELDVTIQIPADPKRALETFQHPYAYAAAHDAPPLAA
jgi:hypothetical protein